MSVSTIAGKSFSFGLGLLTLDPFEGYQLVREHGGISREIRSNSVKATTDYFVVADELANGAKQTAYVDDAKSKGVTVIGESAFWKLIDITPAPEGIADHWVVVDVHMEPMQRSWENRLKKAAETGNFNEKVRDIVGEIGTWARSNSLTENKPAWDGAVAPYKLFIQHSSVKSTNYGGWKIVGCGFLSGDEEFGDNVGSITRLPDGTIVMDTLNKAAVPWAEWRDKIGQVTIVDKYSPSSCAFLFDGLSNCSDYDFLGLDTSNSTSMKAMFRGNASIDSFVTTNRFDTSHVMDMSGMFFGCIGASVVNCIGWDISKVSTMESMFENSPASVLFDAKNVPIPEHIKQSRMFDTTPKTGQWLCRM